LKLKTSPFACEPILTGTGAQFTPSSACVLKFKISDYDFEHKFLVLEESPFKLILGLDFVNSADILMDIPDGKFWLRKTDGKPCKFLRFSNSEFLCALQGLSSLQQTELDQLISEFPEVFFR
jgi:hypothetical protein